MCPRFDSRTRRHMWVEFVVGSRSCSEGFFCGFSSLLENQHFLIPIRSEIRGPQVCRLKPSPSVNKVNLFYLFSYFIILQHATNLLAWKVVQSKTSRLDNLHFTMPTTWAKLPDLTTNNIVGWLHPVTEERTFISTWVDNPR